jgi:predicted DNA-binding helix-hairpin-helix protein
VGATPEEDKTILGLAESLYRRYEMKRVYYSAYVAVGGIGGEDGGGSDSPGGSGLLKVREHRLYQADWLMRFYGFTFSELLDDKRPSLDLSLDPKSEWALRNRDIFPVELDRADYETLLRVPGIGVRSAQRLAAARREGPLCFELVSRLGVVLSRARYFVTCGGKSLVMKDYSFPELRRRLGSGDERFGQLYLFDAVTGEL